MDSTATNTNANKLETQFTSNDGDQISGIQTSGSAFTNSADTATDRRSPTSPVHATNSFSNSGPGEVNSRLSPEDRHIIQGFLGIVSAHTTRGTSLGDPEKEAAAHERNNNLLIAVSQMIGSVFGSSTTSPQVPSRPIDKNLVLRRNSSFPDLSRRTHFDSKATSTGGKKKDHLRNKQIGRIPALLQIYLTFFFNPLTCYSSCACMRRASFSTRASNRSFASSSCGPS